MFWWPGFSDKRPSISHLPLVQQTTKDVFNFSRGGGRNRFTDFCTGSDSSQTWVCMGADCLFFGLWIEFSHTRCRLKDLPEQPIVIKDTGHHRIRPEFLASVLRMR